MGVEAMLAVVDPVDRSLRAVYPAWRNSFRTACYCGRTAKEYIGDFTRAVNELQLTMPPTQPEEKATQYESEMWKIANKEFHDRTKAYNDFTAGLCSVALGKCTEALHTQ